MRKHALILIIGILVALGAMPANKAWAVDSENKYCGTGVFSSTLGNGYMRAYCGLSKEAWWGVVEGIPIIAVPVSSEKEIYETVAKQLSFKDEGLLGYIIENIDTINCPMIRSYVADKKIKRADWPPTLEKACTADTDSSQKYWLNLLQNINTAYKNERLLSQVKKNLEMGFKASEKYWDGKLDDLFDAPFDLMVDLNQIEFVLFGSQADWTNDVFKFPKEEKEEGGEGEGEGEEEQPAAAAGKPAEEGGQPAAPQEEEKPPEEGECLPPDDPDANIPGPANPPPPACGDGKLDPGEQCDDGNKISGDGCGQYCMKEAGAGPPNAPMCRDTEAVTFQPAPALGQSMEVLPSMVSLGAFQQKSGLPKITEKLAEEGKIYSVVEETPCPPGTYPKKQEKPPEIPPAEEYPQAAQSPEYPGPGIGGTLKEFPPSKEPPCPPGETEIKLDVAGGGTGKEASTCIDLAFCTEGFKDVREWLFGEKSTSEEAMAVEAMFCAKVTKANRPTSPYSKKEGCIDCHIAGINDTLDKVLEKNVGPLKNTMAAFSISTGWGPTFSFDLITMVKDITRLGVFQIGSSINAAIESDEEEDRAEASQKRNTPPETQQDVLNQTQAAANKEKRQEKLKMTAIAGDTMADTEFGARIIPLLKQMGASFGSLNGIYQSLADDSIKLAEKTECK